MVEVQIREELCLRASSLDEPVDYLSNRSRDCQLDKDNSMPRLFPIAETEHDYPPDHRYSESHSVWKSHPLKFGNQRPQLSENASGLVLNSTQSARRSLYLQLDREEMRVRYFVPLISTFPVVCMVAMTSWIVNTAS